MNRPIACALAFGALLLTAQAVAQVTLYEGEGFRGRVFRTDKPVANLQRYGFNDRASSVIVERGRWEVCDDAGFRGRCIALRKGSYGSLAAMGLDDRVSSVRIAGNGRRYENEAPVAMPEPGYEYRRRPNERLFEARVLSVRAVGGPRKGAAGSSARKLASPTSAAPSRVRSSEESSGTRSEAGAARTQPRSEAPSRARRSDRRSGRERSAPGTCSVARPATAVLRRTGT